MSECDEIAKGIVNEFDLALDGLPASPLEWEELVATIATALAAERAKFAAEIDRLREKNRELNRREQAATRATADAKRCFDELQKNLGGATPWVGGSLGRALLGWQLRERTEEVQTLRDRLAKFAAFADERGEPRKVLGTLPVTADGAFAGIGGKVFTAWWHEFPKELGGRQKLVGEWAWWYSLQQENICEKIATTAYAAAEAALAAAKEQP